MNVDEARTLAQAIHKIKPYPPQRMRRLENQYSRATQEWVSIVDSVQDVIQQFSPNIDDEAFVRMCTNGRVTPIFVLSEMQQLAVATMVAAGEKDGAASAKRAWEKGAYFVPRDTSDSTRIISARVLKDCNSAAAAAIKKSQEELL